MKLCPITAQNKDALLKLEVEDAQKSFIESVAECLDEADGDARWHPLGLYERQTPVGFAMYGDFGGAGEGVWLDRLLIDRRFQGRGYGRRAVALLLDTLRQTYGEVPVYLSVYEDNARAIRLYKSFGFRMNGEIDSKGEKVMERRL